MYKQLECRSASSPRNLKVQGLGDLQRVLTAGRKVRVAVDREGAGLAGC